MADETRGVRWLRGASEVLLVAMAGLSPWAFGAVEAWAELVLDLGVALLAILGIFVGRGTDRIRQMLSLPSLALGGLALLALAQATPLPEAILRLVAPSTSSLRASLLPAAPERVIDDQAPPVAAPPTTLSQQPESTRNVAARLVAAWLLLQGVLALGAGPARFRRFGVAIVVNATLLALFFLVQALTWNGKIYWIRDSPQISGWSTGGPFVSHNHLAAYLNMGLAFALSFLVSGGRGVSRRRDGNVRLWAAYAAVMLVVGIIASHSRSGFIAMTVSLAVAGLLYRPRFSQVLVGLAVGLVMLGLFLAAMGTQLPIARLFTLAEGKSYANRLEIWGASLRAWLAFPIWGTGLGSFEAAAAPFFRRDHGVVYARAENEYVDLLVEGGIVGLGLGLLLLTGIARLGWRALGDAASPRDRAIILGGLLAVLALATQSVSDFCLHIPGVSVAAVIVSGSLGGLGLAARREDRARAITVPRLALSDLAGLAAAAVSVVVLLHGFHLARSEAMLAGSNIPLAGSAPQPGYESRASGASRETARDAADPKRSLERTRVHLERALHDRPDWAEGYLRLGVTLLQLYQHDAWELLEEASDDPEGRAMMSDPLWLHHLVHAPSPDDRVPVNDLLEQEPVRRYLIPAARSFLQARRCCPVIAMSHAELGGLDYLLDGGDATAVYAGRAARLAGAQTPVLELTARVAAQGGDLALASRCWKRSLEADGTHNWPEIADAAGALLSPDQILDQVLPADGRFALWFAERLYADPKDRAAMARFLKAAAERLPEDSDLPLAERCQLEARIAAGLDDRKRARDRMQAALEMEPLHPDWRKIYIDWLVAWGDVERAYKQALLGLQFFPGDPDFGLVAQVTADARARGTSKISGRDAATGTQDEGHPEPRHSRRTSDD